jgi:hypothetical protein
MSDKPHDHGVTANINDVFRTMIGCRVKGVIFGNASEKLLVFECGWGLAFNTQHGSYWVESPSEVQKKLRDATERLANTKKELSGLLELAGERP